MFGQGCAGEVRMRARSEVDVGWVRGQCLTFCRYLKLKPRPAVIANCLALHQHFAVIYRCPLCQWVGGVVGENAARKIP